MQYLFCRRTWRVGMHGFVDKCLMPCFVFARCLAQAFLPLFNTMKFRHIPGLLTFENAQSYLASTSLSQNLFERCRRRCDRNAHITFILYFYRELFQIKEIPIKIPHLEPHLLLSSLAPSTTLTPTPIIHPVIGTRLS